MMATMAPPKLTVSWPAPPDGFAEAEVVVPLARVLVAAADRRVDGTDIDTVGETTELLAAGAPVL